LKNLPWYTFAKVWRECRDAIHRVLVWIWPKTNRIYGGLK
jgi:hypothetical protein